MEKYLTPKELIAILPIKRSTLYYWTHTGFVPHYKVGKKIFFRETDIEHWMEKRRVVGRATIKYDSS